MNKTDETYDFEPRKLPSGKYADPMREGKSLPIFKLDQDQYKVIQAIKRYEDSPTVKGVSYLKDTTGLPYGKLMSAVDKLLHYRIILRKDNEYHLAAFPKVAIIYPN